MLPVFVVARAQEFVVVVVVGSQKKERERVKRGERRSRRKINDSILLFTFRFPFKLAY